MIIEISVLPQYQKRVGTNTLYISAADIDKSIVPLMLKYRAWEHHVQQLICEYVKPGQNVLDIGANYGQHTVLMSKLVGKGGLVYSIEASNNNYQHLLKTIEYNNCQDNTKALNIGVGEKEEYLTFSHRDENAACSFFSNTAWEHDIHPESLQQIKVLPLDDIQDIQIPIDFIKIDIEGSELFALRGMYKVLKNKPPLAIELNNFTSKNFFNIEIMEVVDYIINEYHYQNIQVFDRYNGWKHVSYDILKNAFDNGAILIDALFE